MINYRNPQIALILRFSADYELHPGYPNFINGAFVLQNILID